MAPGSAPVGDAIEDGAGGELFEVATLVGADGAVRIGKAEAGDRGFVWGSHFVPQPEGVGEEPLCVAGVAVGEMHACPALCRAGGQRLALEPGGDDLEFIAGDARPVEIAGGDRDLDLGVEQRRPPQIAARG